MNTLQTHPDQFTDFEITEELIARTVAENILARAQFPTPGEAAIARISDRLDGHLAAIGDTVRYDTTKVAMSALALTSVVGGFSALNNHDSSPINGHDATIEHVVDSPGETLATDSTHFGEPVATIIADNKGQLPQVNITNPNAPLSPGLRIKIESDNKTGTLKTEVAPVTPAASAAAETAPTNNQIYIVGDSLSIGMEDAGLTNMLSTNGWAVNKVEATTGDSVASALPKVLADAAELKVAKQIIVGLGTNDCELYALPSCESSPEFEAQIQNMYDKIRKINPTAEISWINIYSGKGPQYQSINKAIEIQSKKLGFKVIDWAAEITANPGKYQLDPEMKVHEVSPSGYKNQASFIASQIGKAPVPEAAPAPTTTTTTMAPAPTPAPVASGNEALASPEELVQLLTTHLVKDMGFPLNGAAAIVGNLQWESGPNPERLQGSAFGSHTPASALTPNELNSQNYGYGEAQFTPASKWINYAIAHNKDPNDPIAQLEFIVICLPKYLNEFLSNPNNSASAGALQFMLHYEIPQGADTMPISGYAATSLPHRQANAEAIVNQMQPILFPPPPTTTTTSTLAPSSTTSQPLRHHGPRRATGPHSTDVPRNRPKGRKTHPTGKLR
jgi:hypothetical protein